MATDNFLYAFNNTFQLEIGYCNDPDDHGGETNNGVTEKTFQEAKRAGIISAESVRDLTKADCQKIFEMLYWNRLKLFGVLSREIAAEIFDTSINMGRTAATKIVQVALNYLNEKLEVDGQMGPLTLAAINKWARRDERALFVCLNGFQFQRYVEIVKNDPTQVKFARGWTKRVQTYRS